MKLTTTPAHWLASAGSIALLLVACSEKNSPAGDGDSSGPDNPNATGGGSPSAGDGDTGSGGLGGGTNMSPPGVVTPPTPVDNLPTIRPTRYRIPDPVLVSPPCSANGSGTISEQQLLVGQTHLHSPTHPFVTIAGDRPLSVALQATGSGNAPSMILTASINGTEQGSICLTGPGALPADASDLEASSYRGTLPSAWVKEGLSLSLKVGDGPAEDVALEVAPPHHITLYLLDAVLFGEGEAEEYSDDLMLEFLARLPVSYLDVSHNPFGTWDPAEMIIGARSDGRTPTGETTETPPLLLTENPHCSAEDQQAGTCTAHGGYGVMSGVLDSLSSFMAANALGSGSSWYADLAVALGGGLGGGQRGTGDNQALVMNHELGHGWGFPHWGAQHTDYPYPGETKDRGGFGDSWAIDQQEDVFWSPECDGTERQSPMQRGNNCLLDGETLDPFTDFETKSIARMVLGADEETGMVPYGGSSAEYSFRAQRGRTQLTWNESEPGLHFLQFDESGQLVESAPDGAPVAETEVPVIMFYGAVAVGGPAHILGPVEYIGNVLELLDPSDPADFETLKETEWDNYYWAHDLSLRFTLDDGTTLVQLLRNTGDFSLHDLGSVEHFAINLPRDVGRRVTQVEALIRPFGAYSEETRIQDTDSASNFYENAEVVATWSP